MPVNTCAPCSDPCVRSAAANTELSFRDAVLQILCGIYSSVNVEAEGGELLRINGTYTGSNQQVLPAQGVGKTIRVRSILIGTEDANTDYQFFSRSAGGVNTALAPNFDYLNNAGALGNVNSDGWMETLPNESLVITSNGNIDLLGTAKAIG